VRWSTTRVAERTGVAGRTGLGDRCGEGRCAGRPPVWPSALA